MKQVEEINCDRCFISLSNPLKYLKKDEAQELYYEKACKFYKRGEVLFSEGSKSRGVYCIKKGIIKIFKQGADGKPQILRFAKEGDLIGFSEVLSQENFQASAEIIEDAIICYLPAKIFIEIAKRNPEFSLKLIHLSFKELTEVNQFVVDLAQKTVRERLATIILFLHYNFGTDKNGFINIHLRREEIANLIGTATESAIRLLSEFKNDKIIELKGRNIKILNFKKLKFYANQ